MAYPRQSPLVLRTPQEWLVMWKRAWADLEGLVDEGDFPTEPTTKEQFHELLVFTVAAKRSGQIDRVVAEYEARVREAEDGRGTGGDPGRAGGPGAVQTLF